MYQTKTHLLAELELPKGNYLVFGKADVASSMSSGLPGSPIAFQGLGTARLVLAGRADEAITVLGTVDASGNRFDGARFETICLNLGAELAGTDTVRLLYTPFPTSMLPITVTNIKISAISLDVVKLYDIACKDEVPPDQ
jgi:hypothetical protein